MNGHMRICSVRSGESCGTKRIIRVAELVLCVWLSAFCSGCLALAVGAAGGAAGAVYVKGKLQDEFNRPLPVVHDAAVAAMKDLELKLSEDKVDKISAHMESAFSDGANVWIDMESVSDSRCRITIRVGVTGDEVRSRKIYDSIKQHLPHAQSEGAERDLQERGWESTSFVSRDGS
jgi:RNase adaptor protein for sRNA GlmZ degradation